MNKVQIAYNAMEQFNSNITTMLEGKTFEQVQEVLKESDQLNSNIWLAVYELTKEVNPSLLAEVNAGKYKKDLTQSEICYLDKNWHILEVDTKCPHCHHIAKQ